RPTQGKNCKRKIRTIATAGTHWSTRGLKGTDQERVYPSEGAGPNEGAACGEVTPAARSGSARAGADTSPAGVAGAAGAGGRASGSECRPYTSSPGWTPWGLAGEAAGCAAGSAPGP